MSGTTIQETKDLAYEVLLPGNGLGNDAALTKTNAYEVLLPGNAKGAAAAATKMVAYIVLTTVITPEEVRRHIKNSNAKFSRVLTKRPVCVL